MGEFLDKAKGKFKEVTEAISGHHTKEMKDAAFEQKETLEQRAGNVRENIKERMTEVREVTDRPTYPSETKPPS